MNGPDAIIQVRAESRKSWWTKNLDLDLSCFDVIMHFLQEFAGNAARIHKTRIGWTRTHQQYPQRWLKG